jgi:hypothetical protein
MFGSIGTRTGAVLAIAERQIGTPKSLKTEGLRVPSQSVVW